MDHLSYFATKDVRNPVMAIHLYMVVLSVHTFVTNACNIPLLRQNAWQSFTSTPYPASLAVDGKKFANGGDKTCLQTTGTGTKPWWRVQLDKAFLVKRVKLYQRSNVQVSSSELNIRVGSQSDVSKQSLCASHSGTVPATGTVTMECASLMLGTYIGIQQAKVGDGMYLNVCEVEAYGYGKLTLDGNKASQSSTFSHHSASVAVDGEHAGLPTCTHTQEEPTPWWQIQLENVYAVRAVRIFNRGEAYRRLRELIIGVGTTATVADHSLCAYYNGTVPSSRSAIIECTSAKRGNYVSIKKAKKGRPDLNDDGTNPNRNGGYLTLCEVEVFVCEDISCGEPSDIPSHIAKTGNRYMYTDTVTYMCKRGWTRKSGNKSRTCLLNKEWSGQLLTCERISCGDPPSATRATHTGTNYLFEGTVTYNCTDGWEKTSGDTTRKCTAEGKWSGSPIVCNRASCVAPPVVTGATHTGSNFVFGDTVTYSCMEGWTKSSGDTRRECQANKAWSGQPIVCNRVSCVEPPDATSATKSGSNYLFEGEVRYSCKNGWEKTGGDITRRCLADKSWSGQLIVCTRVSCGEPPTIAGATKSGTNYLFGGEVRYTCKSGWEKWNGSTIGICQSDKTWRGQTIVCNRISCMEPPTPVRANKTGANYLFGDAVKYTCARGFERTAGDVTRICQANKTWSGLAIVCSGISAQMPNRQNAGLYGGVSVAALLFLAVIIVGPILLVRQRRRSRPSYSDELVMAPNKNGDLSMADTGGMSNNAFDETTEHPMIPVTELESHIETLQAGEIFQSEFKDLDAGITAPCTVADKRANKRRNKFQNIKAYDHSRVVLEPLEGDPDSEYVNASYVDGYKKAKTYVASQGANKFTVPDIWRTLWQVKANRIVMLTNLVEAGNRKCEQYWPDNGKKMYADISVALKSAETYADFEIRIFTLTKEGESPRTLRQFHYTAWPDKDVPQFATSLLAFHRKVRSFDKNGRGPLVVHCSAGVGRTGTFIALDYLTEQAAVEKQVNIFDCVAHLRKARPNMVQTLKQYIFVHYALLEALKAGHTAIPCVDFPDEYQKMTTANPKTRTTELQDKFEMLKSYKPSLKSGDTTAAMREENINKNRDKTVLPASSFRAFLTTIVPGDEHNDYINAVYVHGYKAKNAYIATQAPLPGTVLDFWRLVYDHKARTVVMLNQFSDANLCPVYWSQTIDKPLEVGPLRVVCEETEDDIPGIVLRKFKVQNIKLPDGEDREVKQFQVTDWPDDRELPVSADVMLGLLDRVERWQQQTENKPILVHCRNGADRSGLFCVVSCMVEKMKLEQEVDVALAVKKVRGHRPQAIINVEQYQFCHEVALAYMEQFNEYANFK